MAHPLARCRRNRKKEEKKRKAKKKGYTQKMGGLQNGQEVVPLFFFQKKTGFSKFSKTPIFIAFPEKMGGHHFFSKRLCYNEDTFRRAKKMITFCCLLDRNV